MAALTPAQRIYEAAEAAGVLGAGSTTEARTDHAAVAAEVQAREEAGLRVDDGIRAQLRAKYTGHPSLSLNFQRTAYNPTTGEYVTRDDANALADFTANLKARVVADRAGDAAAEWGPDGARNDAARVHDAQVQARMAEAQARMDEMNRHLPRGYPR